MRAAPDTRPSVGLSFLSLFFVFGTILVLNPVGKVLNAVVRGDLGTLFLQAFADAKHVAIRMPQVGYV